MSTLLDVSGLTVDVPALGRTIVDDVSFQIKSSEVLGIVGESGSGKSTVALALLGYAKEGARIAGGRVHVGGLEVLSAPAQELRRFRRETVSYVPQDPGTSLNPSRRIGVQLRDVARRALASGGSGDTTAIAERVRAALEEVALPSSEEFLRRYPFEVSGGQQQRVLIAMATITRPALIVWDEPTTGLDVLTKREIVTLIKSLCVTHQIAGLYISHDLAVVAEIADSMLVMRDGRVIERNATVDLLSAPQEPYTRELLGAVPTLAAPFAARPGVVGDTLLEVSGLDLRYKSKQVLHDVSLQLRAGECLALVGESGSGKSSLSRAIVGLQTQVSGRVELGGMALPMSARARSTVARREIQYVFQNPYASLQPRRTVAASIGLAARYLSDDPRSSIPTRTAEVLERVGLTTEHGGRYPDELSGGERQRASLARALICRPSILLCDEITSALDVSVQAQILALLKELMSNGMSMLFVTHDLAVAKHLAHNVAVLYQGRIVDQDTADAVFTNPRSDYTRTLLGSSLDLDMVRAGIVARRDAGRRVGATDSEQVNR